MQPIGVPKVGPTIALPSAAKTNKRETIQIGHCDLWAIHSKLTIDNLLLCNQPISTMNLQQLIDGGVFQNVTGICVNVLNLPAKIEYFIEFNGTSAHTKDVVCGEKTISVIELLGSSWAFYIDIESEISIQNGKIVARTIHNRNVTLALYKKGEKIHVKQNQLQLA